MSQVKSLLSATLLNATAGFLAALAAFLGWITLPAEVTSGSSWSAEGAYLLPFGIVTGLVSGALVGVLRQLFSRLELILLGILASVAIASVGIILGNFSTGSWVPVMIYAVALLNGSLAVPIANGRSRFIGA